jgi:hypothetical protein
MVSNVLIGTTKHDIFPLNPATCAEDWRTRKDVRGALLPAIRGAAHMDGMSVSGHDRRSRAGV